MQVCSPPSCTARVTLRESSLEAHQQAPKRHPARHHNIDEPSGGSIDKSMPTVAVGAMEHFSAMPRTRQSSSTWTHKNQRGTYKVDWRMLRALSLFSTCCYKYSCGLQTAAASAAERVSAASCNIVSRPLTLALLPASTDGNFSMAPIQGAWSITRQSSAVPRRSKDGSALERS